MGIAGFSSLLKWGVALILAISVIPASLKTPDAIDSDFEQGAPVCSAGPKETASTHRKHRLLFRCLQCGVMANSDP